MAISTLEAEAPVHGVPVVPFEVQHDHLLDDARELMLRVFPGWAAGDLVLKENSGGITNKLVRCVNRRENLTVLIRAYGRNTEIIIDRGMELANMAGLASQGVCPPVYARFANGLVYGYIPGTVPSPEEMGSAALAPLIARKLAEWGQISLPGDRTPQLLPTLRRWLQDIPACYGDARKDAVFREHFSLDMLRSELAAVEQLAAAAESPVVFAHNDLLSGNIVLSASGDAVSFIDYEYATYNYRGFDIANHFNEYAGFECDYSRYPAKDAQLAWFRAYLEHIGLDASPAALERMHREVALLRPASHYYWGVWALVQAAISDIDFDYLDYARLRFAKYFEDKAQLQPML
ncbi:hypothetical protein H4R18_002099 [Coemansia javaensis]|uniref:ethanolamine kinase n=1 Tax=Coemansia javaensis TaxID=2761396 RepID=A0A9W8HHP9_9FUNG|nr:hypothetical protein H4R18_002099 [Coemansia javaensis]